MFVCNMQQLYTFEVPSIKRLSNTEVIVKKALLIKKRVFDSILNCSLIRKDRNKKAGCFILYQKLYLL